MMRYFLILLLFFQQLGSLEAEKLILKSNASPFLKLDQYYHLHAREQENLHQLRILASECASVLELWEGSFALSWGVFKGLSENQRDEKSYVAIHSFSPELEELNEARQIAESHGIHFQFLKDESFHPIDLMLIDSIHDVDLYALELFAPIVTKYIALYRDSHLGYYIEPHPLILDFLDAHPEWCLKSHTQYDGGMTVLQRRQFLAQEKIEKVLQEQMILCSEENLYVDHDLHWIPFKEIVLYSSDDHSKALYQIAMDPAYHGDDIVLFKMGQVFINDMELVQQCVSKLLEGYDCVTRYSDRDLTDVFFIKVSALRQYHSLFCSFPLEQALSQIPKVFRIAVDRIDRHWEDNELGFYHVFPGKTKACSFWNKRNLDCLFSTSATSCFQNKTTLEQVVLRLGNQERIAIALRNEVHAISPWLADQFYQVVDLRYPSSMTFKQALFDAIFPDPCLRYKKIALIECDLKGEEEGILEDLLYFAYHNKTKICITLYPDLWEAKKMGDFNEILKHFKISALNSVLEELLYLEPVENGGVMTKKEIPAVIIGYNLLTCIQNMVSQLEKYTSDIIVIDNKSDFPPLLDYYQKDYPYTLLKMPENAGSRVFHDPFIQSLLGDLYLVTDPDLQLNPRLPERFIEILQGISSHFKADRVGFALNIDAPDLRADLFLDFDGVRFSISDWEKRFWVKRLYDPYYPDLELYEADIDTTFCLMNRRYEAIPYRIRVAGDFTCNHLPWHTNFLGNLAEGEYEYYKKNNISTTWEDKP